MKKQVEDDYEIIVDEMQDMTTGQEAKEFKIVRSSFYNRKGHKVAMHILVRNSENKTEQIFSMKDGMFILEVEDEDGELQYFGSKDLNDLI